MTSLKFDTNSYSPSALGGVKDVISLCLLRWSGEEADFSNSTDSLVKFIHFREKNTSNIITKNLSSRIRSRLITLANCLGGDVRLLLRLRPLPASARSPDDRRRELHHSLLQPLLHLRHTVRRDTVNLVCTEGISSTSKFCSESDTYVHNSVLCSTYISGKLETYF